MAKMTVHYFQTPNAIFEVDLTIHQKMVYIYLCRRNNQGGDAYPGYSRIARDCGISKRQAQYAVKVLESKGYIKVERRRKSEKMHDTNLYQVNHRIGSAQRAPGVAQDVQQGNADDAPEEEPLKKNHIKKSDASDIEKAEQVAKGWINLLTTKAEIEPKQGIKFIVNKLLDSNLLSIDYDTLYGKMERFIDTADDFVIENDYPIGSFINNYEKIKEDVSYTLFVTCEKCDQAKAVDSKTGEDLDGHECVIFNMITCPDCGKEVREGEDGSVGIHGCNGKYLIEGKYYDSMRDYADAIKDVSS